MGSKEGAKATWDADEEEPELPPRSHQPALAWQSSTFWVSPIVSSPSGGFSLCISGLNKCRWDLGEHGQPHQRQALAKREVVVAPVVAFPSQAESFL